MSAAAIARLRALLPARMTLEGHRAHEALDDVEALLGETEEGLRSMSDMNVELLRQMGGCERCMETTRED